MSNSQWLLQNFSSILLGSRLNQVFTLIDRLIPEMQKNSQEIGLQQNLNKSSFEYILRTFKSMYISILQYKKGVEKYDKPVERFIQMNFDCLKSAMERTGREDEDTESLANCPMNPLFYHNIYNIFQFYRATVSPKEPEDRIRQFLSAPQYSKKEDFEDWGERPEEPQHYSNLNLNSAIIHALMFKDQQINHMAIKSLDPNHHLYKEYIYIDMIIQNDNFREVMTQFKE